MEILIQIEEFICFLGCIYLFSRLNLKWWWFPVLLLVPDLSMAGYAINTNVGAVLYNIVFCFFILYRLNRYSYIKVKSHFKELNP